MHSAVTWRIQKEKKKVHHLPGKTADTTSTTCTGTLDKVKCTEMRVPGMVKTEEGNGEGKMEVFSLSNNIAYTASANHKLEVDADPEYETIPV